ncbi:MAG TPA: carbonic anhydrase family protein [Puia sp.]|nr:carbonic anhydrase family protein [Puia sp.]
MKIKLFVFIPAMLILSCRNIETGSKEISNKDSTSSIVPDSSILISQVLTKAQQDKLTPDQVIESLTIGNEDFVNDLLTVRNNSGRIREAALGQYPKAVILSCLDSRIPVEDVFHKGIGDLFVARVAGNIVNEDILGSLEFACKVSGSKLIVVMGHEYCGAIKSAIDGVQLGNITALLSKIKPAVQYIQDSLKTKGSSSDAAFVDLVCRENVELAIQNIRKKSPILREMEKKGEIKIIGSVYHMKSGKVDFF